MAAASWASAKSTANALKAAPLAQDAKGTAIVAAGAAKKGLAKAGGAAVTGITAAGGLAKKSFAKLPAKGKVAVVGGSLVLGAAAVAHVVYHHGKKVDEQQVAAEEQQAAVEEQQVSADDQVPEAPAQDAEAGQQ